MRCETSRFLRWRTQLHRIRERTVRTEPLDQNNARDLEQVVRIFWEVDVGPVSSSSTTQKRLTCESFFYLYSLIRCSRIASDEENVNNLLCDARLRVRIFWKQNFTVRSFGPVMAKSTKLLQFYLTQNFLSL